MGNGSRSRRPLCRLVRGPHRLPAGRCRHAPAQYQRLYAQPAAHGHGQLSGQGPGTELAPGEAYFAEKLNDFDLAANNGGWQWAASTGCDAQPWFRIFNPVTQSEKFDPDGKFIARYVPELAALPSRLRHAPWLAKPLELAEAGITLGSSYPYPVVDHAAAREKTLARYGILKNNI